MGTFRTQREIEATARQAAIGRELHNREAYAGLVPDDISASVLPQDITQVGRAIAAIRREGHERKRWQGQNTNVSKAWAEDANKTQKDSF